uniref:wiskott-Aldrich syndrome protein homolog 1-like isoform X1 n=1 Tax=Ictidomys tridecemlineatus TaxID=43179 RepID=UPI001A9D9D4A|nr:wiskott-Aldrich syndrome protein homolog 1-like isoform X1 [Ictidomys tridecemlineatus]
MGTRAPRGHLPLPALQKPVSRARSSSPVPNGPTGRKSRPAARPWPGRPPSPLPHPAPRDRRAGVAKATEEGADYISHPPPRRAPVRLSVRPSVRAQKGPGVGPAAAPWTALRRLPSLGTGNLVTCAGVLASAGHIHKNLSSPRSGCFNIPLPKSAVADRPKGDLSLVTIPQGGLISHLLPGPCRLRSCCGRLKNWIHWWPGVSETEMPDLPWCEVEGRPEA